MNVTLYGKRGVVDEIKLRILRWGDYPGLSEWGLNVITSVLIRGRQGASLVAQWLRIRLPMQGTWVRALVWEDSHMPRSN